MFKIPQENKKFQQDNSSDRKGNIHITKNISFDNAGYITLADRTRTFASTSTLADLCTAGYPYIPALVLDSGGTDIWALGTKNIYKSDEDTPMVFVKDTDASFPTLDLVANNDALEFSNDMYVVNDTGTMYKKVGSTWSTISVDTASCLCLFENLNQLAVGGDNQVELFNTSDVSQNILTLPPDYVITKMAWNKNKLGIATTNTKKNKAVFFIWDGLSAEANEGYPVPKGNTIFSVVPYKDGFSCVTSAGELLYNSGGWQLLDRFPIYYTKYLLDSLSSDVAASRNIFPNAMITDGDCIYIGLNTLVSQSGNSNTPRRLQDFTSGVWCYDPEVGLHLKYSLDSSISLTSGAILTSSVNTTTNIITVSGVTVPETGTPVFYYNGTATGIETSSATPLNHGKKYYTIYQTDTTLKLATTYANAIANTAIDITATGNNAQYLEFVKSNMFGGVENIGSLMLLDHDFQSFEAPSRFGRLLIGGSTRLSDNTEIAVLASVVTDQENRGYLITPKLESQQIDSTWQKLVIKHKPLVNADDKIVVKYRVSENTLPNYETYNISNVSVHTWVDGNTYTTTQDISAVKTRADAGILDEVEFYNAQGTGYLAHITSITETGGTYTVNIDETIPSVTAGDKVKVFYSNWTKLGEITNAEFNPEQKEFDLGFPSSWVQFKIELRGVDTTISQILVDNQELK